MENISLNSDDAIVKKTAELNLAMVAFDRWVNQNPTKTNMTNDEFRQMKQNIKLIRLRIRELVDMRDEFQNMLHVANYSTDLFSIDKEQFSKPRNTPVLENRQSNKLGTRAANKLSKG